jgi:hypothetical protein
VFDLEKYMQGKYGFGMGEVSELTFYAPLDDAFTCTIYRGEEKVGDEVHDDVVQALSKWWGDQKDLRMGLLEKRVLDAVGSLNQMAEGYDIEGEISRLDDRLYSLNYRRFTA